MEMDDRVDEGSSVVGSVVWTIPWLAFGDMRCDITVPLKVCRLFS